MSAFVRARISDKAAFSNLSATRYRAAISHNVEGILYLASETKDCILYLARFAQRTRRFESSRSECDRSWAQRNRLRSLETGQLIPLLCTIYVLCSCILPSYCFLLSREKERKDVRRGERRLENRRRTCRSEKIVSEIKWKEKEKRPRSDGWVRTLETTCAYGHV